MFYVFPVTLGADYSASDPYQIELQLRPGVIHQVDFLFQGGCNHAIYAQIKYGKYQMWPTNTGAWLRGNATVISFREFYELKPGADILTANFYSTLGADWKEVIIQLGILPKQILQPLSFEALTQAAGIK